MTRYLYVTDIEGREIVGSRRSIERVGSQAQLHDIQTELAAAAGEGCSVEDNVEDWSAFWAERD